MTGQAFGAGETVAVLTTEPVGPFLDYRAPEGGCATGDFVTVPLGPRLVPGVVWGKGEGAIAQARLRAITRVLDFPPMRIELRHFLERAADYTLTPLPAMLRLATRVPDLLTPPAARRILRLAGPVPNRLTEARHRVIEVIRQNPAAAMNAAELAHAASCSPGVIKGLRDLGVLVEEEAPRDLPYPALTAFAPRRLIGDQIEAGDALIRVVISAQYQALLLKGVTGSGKTEVYLEAVEEVLRRGRQALVLLPEIALTADFLKRVESRFGGRPGEWHSGVNPAERRRLWRMAGEGGVGLVVGARSALFLPFQDLALIVVDEEHDSSYKQEEGVLYNARDMAVLRASIIGCPVVLASATPSLETWVNAESGKYQRLDLDARFGEASMPHMKAIDMRREKLPANRWISPSLAAGVRSRLAAGEQSLLFLNRRGYAPVTICRACGAQIGCDHCDARMVEHRSRGQLICHQCGAAKPVPTICPSCGVEGKLVAVGPGVERLAEEVGESFPDARLAVLSSDLFTTAHELKAQIDRIAAGEADIIIGTQIVAKGHNFPHLTLVGVIDADLGLQGSDLRAAERTFQLMRQVAGRAGRAEKPGEAWLQTYQPEHPVIRAILGGDEEAFWRAEAGERHAIGAPPFGRMAGIILTGPDAAQLYEIGNVLIRQDAPLRRVKADVFGPAPAPLARRRGKYRVRLLVKAAKTVPLQAALREWISPVHLPRGVRLAVDIDPQSFL